MTAAEFTDLDHPKSALDLTAPLTQGEHINGEHVDVFVDDEWCVVDGYTGLAELLHIKSEAISGAPIGRLLHPDDVSVSPARIWRSGRSAVLKFRFADDGYRRLAVKIRRATNGWLLSVSGVEAEVVHLPKLPAVKR